MAQSEPKPLYLTGPEVAALLGVSIHTLQNYLKGKYPIPRQSNKKYYSPDVGKWLKEKIERDIRVDVDKDPNVLNPVAERARKDKEQADKVALENQVRRGELVEIGITETAWTLILMRVRTRLLAMPSSLAPLLSAEDDPANINKIIEDSVHEALAELSQTDDTDGE